MWFPRLFQSVQNSLTFPWLENALPFSRFSSPSGNPASYGSMQPLTEVAEITMWTSLQFQRQMNVNGNIFFDLCCQSMNNSLNLIRIDPRMTSLWQSLSSVYTGPYDVGARGSVPADSPNNSLIPFHFQTTNPRSIPRHLICQISLDNLPHFSGSALRPDFFLQGFYLIFQSLQNRFLLRFLFLTFRRCISLRFRALTCHFSSIKQNF